VGWDQDWCIYHRDRLHQMLIISMDKLMDYYECQKMYETSLAYGMQILLFDSAREATHRRLMRLHYLNGDRALSLRQYEKCVKSLENELSVQPSNATVTLYLKIKRDEAIEKPVQEKSQSASDFLSMSQVIQRLKTKELDLMELQRQLIFDIDLIENLINQ
jgi:DNA-binding SARP family transcriptional activator